MAINTRDPRPGVRKSHSVVSISSASTNTTVYQRTTSGTARTYRVTKLFLDGSGISSAATFSWGVDDGSSGVTEYFPRIRVEPGLQTILTEDEIPAYELVADLVAQSTVATLRVQVEVEEFGQ